MIRITIRPASEPDYHELCYLEQGPSGCWHQAAVYIRQVMTLWPGSVLVAEYDGTIAGFLVGARSPENMYTSWILRVRVKEEMRRKGVATALLNHSLLMMRSLMMSRILLSCSPENHGALALYTKNGFVVSHYEEDYFGPDEHRVILALDLSTHTL